MLYRIENTIDFAMSAAWFGISVQLVREQCVRWMSAKA